MKKAYLVEVSIMTRVIVDEPERPEDFEAPDVNEEADAINFEAGEIALDKIARNRNDYLILENVISAKPDTECPYNPENDKE